MAIRYSSSGGTPFGDSNSRPSNPLVGQTYYNGTLGYLEIYTSTGWIPATGANDLNINLTETNTVVNFPQTYSSGSYSIVSLSNDATLDIYAYAVDGTLAGYTNTKSFVASQRFNKMVILGGTTGDVLSFSYKTTYTTSTSTTDVTAGPYITSITPTGLPNKNDTMTISGGNFATNVTVAFTGTGYSSTAAKSIVRTSSTQLIVTRPDNFPTSGAPYTVTITNPSIANQPTGSAVHIYSPITAGAVPIWVTSGTLSTTISPISGAAYSANISATDADGGSSVTYSIISGSLPSGFSLNSSTGVITGTASATTLATYNYPFTVRATDSGGNYADQSLTITNTLYASVSAIRSAGITTNGSYWFSTAKQTTPFQAYCRFNYIDGGDWYLLLKLYNRSDMPSGSTYWTNTTTYNNTDFNLSNTTWSKYDTWNGIAFTKVMMDMNGKIPPIMNFSQSKTMAEAITASGATLTSGGSGYFASSTDPAVSGNGIMYSSLSMKSGTAFSRQSNGQEPYMTGYGIGIFAGGASGHTIPGTSDAAFGSLPTTYNNGAWIGSALDDGTSSPFLGAIQGGADSGFGIGFNTGNVNRTGSSGLAEWQSGSITDALPAYVWVR